MNEKALPRRLMLKQPRGIVRFLSDEERDRMFEAAMVAPTICGHTCASYLAQNGATDMELRAVLGHKTTAMVARYAHMRPGAAVRGHHAIGAKLRGK